MIRNRPAAVLGRAGVIGLAIATVAAATRAAGPADTAGPPVTRITMHLHHATPEKIFAELNKQAGTDLRPEPADLWKDHKDPVDIDVDAQPFWVAVQQIGHKTKLHIGTEEEMGPELAIYANFDSDGLTGPSQAHDGFLTTVTSTYRNSFIDLTEGGELKRKLSVDINVYPDPKWRVLETTGFVLTEAVDDKGQNLIGEPGSAELQKNTQWPIGDRLELKCPDQPGKKIINLKGSIKVRLVTKTQRIEIDSPDHIEGTRKSVGQCRIVFKAPAHENTGVQFPFTVESSGAQSDAGLKQLEDSEATLLYPDGKAALPDGGDFDPEKGKYAFQFYPRQTDDGKPQNPSKLILEVPVETVVVTVPFEFKDLPIPP